MVRSRCPIVILILAAFAGLMQPAPASAQIAYVSIKSADELLADFRYLAPIVGQKDLVKQLDLSIGAGNKGLEGIDRNRPLGVYVLWPEKITKLDELNFPVVAFVPLNDDKAFLKLLPKFGAKVEKGEGDTQQITIPDGTVFSMRLANKHAYISMDAKAVAGKLPEPSAFLPKEEQKSSVVARLMLDHLPKESAKLIDELMAPLQEAVAPFADVGKKKTDETEEQYAERLAAARQIKQVPDMAKLVLTNLFGQGKEISLALDVDRKEHRVGLSLALTPRPDTEMATAHRALGGGRSRFGPLLDKADGGVLIHIPPVAAKNSTVPDADAFAAMMRNALPLSGPLREPATKLFGIFFATLALDGIDFGFLVTLPTKDDPIFLVGLKVQNGKKVDQALRDLYKSLPTEDKKDLAVDWNHDKHGTARIHRGRPAGMGEDLYLAIRDDVMILAAGKGCMGPLKQALDSFGKGEPPVSPIVRARVSSRAILMDEDIRKATEDLTTAEREKLFAELTLEGGSELRLRVRASTPLLRLFAPHEETSK